MNKFLLVKSNLKHNDANYKTWDVIEGTLGEYQNLLNDGVVEVLECETIEDAIELSKEKKERAEALARGEEVVPEKNTWGPTEDDTEVDETVQDGLMELTHDKLLKLARKEKVEDVKTSMTKKQLVSAIRAVRSPEKVEDKNVDTKTVYAITESDLEEVPALAEAGLDEGDEIEVESFGDNDENKIEVLIAYAEENKKV